MALPTHGRVLLDTTVGDIDIELWSKEAPKACRNFIALAMEGYYDGVIFHRVVPDFLVQTGDRTGSGSGGESFFGEAFEDEIHPRLRFAHRGSHRADELQGKHTLFGRCVGDTIYSVSLIQLDDNGRPVYPPKIKTVRIIDNPFDDIVPRITAEEKRAQQRARQTAIREREEIVRRKGAKKDTKLLSFGADADEEAEGVSAVIKKKSVARPDLVENLDQQSIPSPSLDRLPSKSEKVTRGESKRESDSLTTKPNDENVDLSKIREAHQREKAASGSARQTEIERMEAEVKRLARQRDGEDSDEDRNVKKAKKRSQLDEELAKYQKGRGVHRKGQNKDESNVLAVLAGFRSKLQTSVTAQDEADQELGGAAGGVGEQAIEGGTGIELDNDRGFMGHLLNFPKGNEEEVQKAEREYEVIDPRVRSAQARQEERERKHASRMGNKGPVRHGRR
ncbi:cyclophilin-like protein [Lactarius pseudohatsudake]|nr:cyclophilin-like protein [Lactarius pseudohatsudake]